MKKLKILFLLLLASTFISCATTLKFDVLRPAEIDLGNAKSIAIEPVVMSKLTRVFEGPIVTKRITNFIEKKLELDLTRAGYYKVIGPKDKVTPADVYLDTQITIFDVRDHETTKRVKNPRYHKATDPKDTKGKRRPVEPEYINQTTYTRDVVLVFRYDIVQGNSDKTLYSDEFRINKHDSVVDNKHNLKDAYNMVESELSQIIQSIEQKLQPYYINRTVTLLKVKKNAAMDYAIDLAEDKKYQESYNQFINIYRTTGLMEAGYNAALLLEVSGNYHDAQILMDEVYTTTLNPDALKELNLINNELSQQKKVNLQNKKRNE